MLSPSPEMKILSAIAKSLEKQKFNFSVVPLHMKTRVSLKYLLNDCLWKQFLASYFVTDPFKFDLLDYFHKFNAFDSFNLRLEQLICKRAVKVVFLDNFFPYLFTEVQIWYIKRFKFSLGCY